MEGGSDGIGYDLFDLDHDVSFKVDLFVRVSLGQIFLKRSISKFVSRLVLSIVFRVLLDSVVHKMDELVLEVVHRVFSGSSSQVTISVEISFNNAIDAGDQREASNIKFSSLVKKRIVNVLLDNHTSISSTVGRDLGPYLAEVLFNPDANTSVGILTRLDDPNVLPVLCCSDLSSLSIIIIFETSELRVIEARLDMEGKRQGIKDMLASILSVSRNVLSGSSVLLFATIIIVISHIQK